MITRASGKINLPFRMKNPSLPLSYANDFIICSFANINYFQYWIVSKKIAAQQEEFATFDDLNRKMG